VYRTAQRTIPVNQSARWQVDCPGEAMALGGGVATRGFPFRTQVNETAPAGDGTGWLVAVSNEYNSALSEYAWVICADIPTRPLAPTID
jgi:hypothetical protein